MSEKIPSCSLFVPVGPRMAVAFLALLAQTACTRPDGAKSPAELQTAALTGVAVVTVDPNGAAGPIGFQLPGTFDPVLSADLPAGQHFILHFATRGLAGDAPNETLGSFTLTAAGGLTLDANAMLWFDPPTSPSPGRWNLRVKKVVNVTLNPAGLSFPEVALWFVAQDWSTNRTVGLIANRRYHILDYWSTSWNWDAPTSNLVYDAYIGGAEGSTPVLQVRADGTVAIDDPTAQQSFSAAGTTVTAKPGPVLLDLKDYPGTDVSLYPGGGPTTPPGTPLQILKGRRYDLYGSASRDPNIDTATFDPWDPKHEYEYGLFDLSLDQNGVVNLGAGSKRHFTVVAGSPPRIVARIGYLRIFRDGYQGSLCLSGVVCAPGTGDLEVPLIIERRFFVVEANNAAVRVKTDWSCSVSTIQIGGKTLRVRCGQTAPGPLPPVAPSPPTGLSGVQGGPARVDLAWSDAAGETSYRVQRLTAGNFVDIATLGADVLTHSDDAAVEGATNQYRVIAFNGAGPSNPSNVVSVAVSAPGAPCGDAGNLCPDPAFAQFNHNLSRLDYRLEPTPLLITTVPGPAETVPDAAGGEASGAPRTVSCVGSRVDNLRWSFTQDSSDFASGPDGADCPSCGCGVIGKQPSLQIRRYHRPRLEPLASSFGPGVFSNFDARVTFYKLGIDAHPNAVVFDPESDGQQTTLFERSAADSDSQDDGIFRDSETRVYRRLVLYNATTPSSSARVSSAAQAVLAVLEKHDGGAIWFELVGTQTGAPDQIEGRPIAYLDRNGKKLTVTYQFARTATDATLGYDRTQLWKISKLTDVLHGHELTVAYERRSTTGRWVVKTITSRLDDGTTRAYTYDYASSGGSVDLLSKVTYPDGDTSLFSKSFDAASQQWAISYDDVGSGRNLVKTVYVTGAFFRTPSGAVRGQTTNLVRRVLNGSQEEVFRNQEDPNDRKVGFVVEANRRLSRYTTDDKGAPKEVARARSLTSDPRSATYDRLESYQANTQGMITQVTDGAGKSKTLVRDAQTRRVTGLTARDGTTASWTYNATGDPTHQVDRKGGVTDFAYDSRGNPTTITRAPGNSLQNKTSYTYDATTGLVTSMTDPLGKVTNYDYTNNRGYLASITDPPDTSGGTRAVTKFENTLFGRVTASVDASGRRTTYQYDARNRLITTTYPDGSTATITYGTRATGGLVVARKNRNGTIDSYEYDATRRLKRVLRASNRAEKSEEVYEYLAGTELESAITRLGVRTEFTYDERNRLSQVVQYPTNGKTLITRRSFDGSDRLVNETDPYGRATLYVYDAVGRTTRLLRELVPGGVPSGSNLATLARPTGTNPPYVFEEVTYDGMSRVASATDGRGVVTGTSYDVLGRRTQTVVASGTSSARTTAFEYDLAGNITKITYPRTFREGRAFATTFTFNGRGLMASKTEAAGAAEAATTKYTYTPTRQTASETDPRGATRSYTYDSNDRLSKGTDEGGFATTIKYDAAGNPISRTDPLGRVTTFAYDAENRKVSSKNPASETTSIQYDDNLTDGVGLDATYAAQLVGLGFGPKAAGRAILATNGAGEKVLEVFDAVERTVLVLDPAGNATRMAYDTIVAGLLETATTDPLGNVARTRADGNGHVRLAIDAAGKQTTRQVDLAGSLVSSRDANGTGVDCVVDELGQRRSCTDTQGDTTTFEYDGAGNQTARVDGRGVRTTTTFDTLNRRASATDGLGNTSRWTYDLNGNLTKITDAQGGDTSYGYDARNLKTSATLPDSNSSTDKLSWTYDGARQITSRTLQNGNVITHGYDAAGRLIQRSYPDGKNDTYAYDLASRMKTAASARYGTSVAFTYDVGGRTSKESLTYAGQTYTVTQGYDAASRPTLMKFPDGTDLVRGFTSRGQLATLALGSQAIAGYQYDDGGRLATSTLGNGLVETRSYRSDNTLSTLSAPGVGDLSYTYDKAKRKVTEGGSAMPGGTQAFVYDDAGRPVQWSQGSNSQRWVLSAEGDWTSTTVNNTTETRTHNAAHELTAVGSASLSYTARGDMTKNDKGDAMTWDLESRLQKHTRTSGSTTTTVTYVHDALGRRVAKTVGTSASSTTTTTVFVSFGPDVVAEYVNGALARKYILGVGPDHYVAMVNQGAVYWYTRNSVGSVNALSDASGAVVERYRYTAFGERTILSATGATRSTSLVNNQVGFTARYHDADTGLLDFRFRQYDARLGRFISRDDDYHDGLSLYFAQFVPNFTDPSGHFSFGGLVSSVGNALGAAASAVGSAIVSAAQAVGGFIADGAAAIGTGVANAIATAGSGLASGAEWVWEHGGKWVVRMALRTAIITGARVGLAYIFTYAMGPVGTDLGYYLGAFLGGVIAELVDAWLDGSLSRRPWFRTVVIAVVAGLASAVAAVALPQVAGDMLKDWALTALSAVFSWWFGVTLDQRAETGGEKPKACADSRKVAGGCMTPQEPTKPLPFPRVITRPRPACAAAF
jgi:RHS repeat-associated protein